MALISRVEWELAEMRQKNERLRAALCEIRDARLNIPPLDIVANMRATAIVALGDGTHEQEGDQK